MVSACSKLYLRKEGTVSLVVGLAPFLNCIWHYTCFSVQEVLVK